MTESLSRDQSPQVSSPIEMSNPMPAGFALLLSTDFWLRLAYFGLRSLLVIYMVSQIFQTSDFQQKLVGYDVLQTFVPSQDAKTLASSIFRFFMFLILISPIIGGLSSDLGLGRRNSVILGGVLLASGSFALAVESLLLPALILFALGYGFIMPSLVVQIGNLFSFRDHRRERAFLYTILIHSVAGFLAALIFGVLGESLGMAVAFVSLGIVVAIGTLPYAVREKSVVSLKEAELRLRDDRKIKGFAIDRSEKHVLLAIGFLLLMNALYSTLFNPESAVSQIVSEGGAELSLFGYNIPGMWIVTVAATSAILFFPLVLKGWSWQNKSGQSFFGISKVAASYSIFALASAIMCVVTLAFDQATSQIIWLGLGLTLFSFGGLYLSPVIRSILTRHSPPRFAATLIGIFSAERLVLYPLSGTLADLLENLSKSMLFGLMSITALIIAFVLLRNTSKIEAVLEDAPQR